MNTPRHLEHLRRDRRGIPVPYVNRWGPEQVETMSLRHDPFINMLAVFVDDSAEPVPDFTAQNVQRQRECMIRGLCQVCHRGIPWTARYMVVAPLSVDRITVDGAERWAISEPWLCGLCASFAVKVCPALIRRRRDEQLRVVPVERRDVGFSVSHGRIDGPLAEESQRLQPAMLVRALVHDLDRQVVAR